MKSKSLKQIQNEPDNRVIIRTEHIFRVVINRQNY